MPIEANDGSISHARDMACRYAWAALALRDFTVCDVLEAVGLLDGTTGHSSDDLWALYDHKVDQPYRGCLVFYKDDQGALDTVGLCLDSKFTMIWPEGLSGMLARIDFTEMIAGYADPFYPEDGDR